MLTAMAGAGGAAGAASGAFSGLSGLSTALSAIGSLAQGIAASQAAKAQAQIAEQNAQIAESQADIAQQDSAEEQRRVRREGEQFAGQQKSLLGASGVSGSYGSALSLLMDTHQGVEDDAANIKLSGDRRAWGYRAQSVNYKNQASASRSQAKSAMFSGIIGAGTSLLSSSVLSSPKVSSSWTWKGYDKKSSLIHPDRMLR
nr:hypothetical protein [uncultured Dethiosulfovibrio sp.]